MGNSSPSEFNYDQQLLNDRKPQGYWIGDEQKGATRILRGLFPDGKEMKEIMKYPYPEENDGGYKTIWEAFQRGAKLDDGKKNCLGTRSFTVDSQGALQKDADGYVRGPYVWQSYAQVTEQARALAAGLVSLGAKEGENVGLWAINRAEWVTSALAVYSQGFRVVALYATLGDENVGYIINHSNLRIIVTEKDNVGKLLNQSDKLKELTTIIQFDVNDQFKNLHETVDEKHLKLAEEKKIRLLSFSDVLKMGREKPVDAPAVKDSDLAFIMYTSGTTGVPKGALLSHGNLVSAVAGTFPTFKLASDDVHLSYLPLAHIFETVAQLAVLVQGGSVGFFQGNVKKLTNDMSTLQPTLLCGVPRVFSKIYQRVFAGVSEKNFLVRWFFNKAYQSQCDAIRAGRPKDAGYDKKIFAPLRERVGLSRVRVMVSGAAPCPPYLLEFLRVVVNGAVVQGYGMTETSALTSLTSSRDPNVGHCGPIAACVEAKLVDVPEMNYLSTNNPPTGEVCLRGANIFRGYYLNDEATKEALDEDGWLHTGDVGRVNPNFTLSIIDRKKNLFKLSQGEYIAVEKVEAVYAKSKLVGQIWVYGNSFKASCVAVVVPTADEIQNICLERGWWPRSKEESKLGSPQFIQDFHAVLTGPHKTELKQLILTSLRAQEKELKGFEKLTDILIESQIDATGSGFTESNECLTPTFKLRRAQLLAKYIKELKALYEANGEPNAPSEKWPGE